MLLLLLLMLLLLMAGLRNLGLETGDAGGAKMVGPV
jgi:hypothetical protein